MLCIIYVSPQKKVHYRIILLVGRVAISGKNQVF